MNEQITNEPNIAQIVIKKDFDCARRCLVANGVEYDEADIVLQALCYILLDEETEHFFFDAEYEGNRMKNAGITIEEIRVEMEYRREHYNSSPNLNWDNVFHDYIAEELEEILKYLENPKLQ